MDEFDDSHSSERFRQAMVFKRNGEYDAALDLLRAILGRSPNKAQIWHEIGLIRSYQVEIDESIAALEKAVELEPDSRIYLTNLGKTYAMFGNYREARRVFDRLQEWDGGGEPDAAA